MTENEIKENNWNLNITLYVELLKDSEKQSFEECISVFNDAKIKYIDSHFSVLSELKNWDLNV